MTPLRAALLTGALAAAGLAACARDAGPRSASPRPSARAAASHEAARYDVVGASDGTLDVVARFPAGTSSRFFVEPGAESFVVALAPEPDRAGEGRGEPFVLECSDGCELRYRFDLPAAAAAFDHVGYASRAGDAWLAPPSTWLLHPRDGDLSRRFELRVSLPPGHRFATGLPPVGDGGAVGATLADLPSAPYSALGRMRSHRIQAAGASVDLSIVGGVPVQGDDVLVDWVREASLDVSELLGAPVTPHAMVLVDVRAGGGLSLLTALGNGGASIHAPIGRAVDPAVLAGDWRMTHEFVHLGSPNLQERHDWFGEGLATYLEPIARVRRGRHTVEELWRDLIDGLPQGQPGPDDAGLDRTPTWGRTYWGGALFCFVADVEARRRTDGKRSLVDAFRAIHAAGGDVRQRWSMYRLIEVGDRGVGAPVLAELYAEHRHRAVRVDLEAMWRDLGVVPTGDRGVRFDDTAPLASVRRAITAR